MSVKNSENPIRCTFDHTSGEVWNFTGFREVGFNERGTFVVDAYTTPQGDPRGTFFTCLPISPIDYRRNRPTQTGFKRLDDRELVVYDDWGKSHSIEAPTNVINALVQECIANEIPLKD